MSTTTEQPSLYRVSVLVTGFARMWRAWRVVLPVVIANALLQGLLALTGLLPYLTIAFVLVALLSFVALVVSFGLVAPAALQAAEGPVSAKAAISTLRARIWPLLAWGFGLVSVAVIGFSLNILPGFLILALSPYLLIAVIDGQRNPLAANFRTIGAHWFRWLVTVVIMGAICYLLWVASALLGFFVTGAPAVVIGWLVLGLVSSWYICAWSLIYRSVNPRS